MEEITSRTGISGSVCSLIGGRKENQDSYGSADTPFGLLVAVCDGMGGGPAGKTASENATEAIIAHVMGQGPDVNIPEMLAQAIQKANERLIDMQQENNDLIGMGTTAVVLLLTSEYAYIAHVGDSRLYQLRGSKMVFRTADHSFVGELVRKGTITEEQARTASNSNIITRAVGIRPDLDVELDTVQYKVGDRFALMSDGIWGAMPEPELIKLLTARADPGAVVDKMVHIVDEIGNRKGGMHDNLTLAVVDVAARKATPAPGVTPPPATPPVPAPGQMPAPAPGQVPAPSPGRVPAPAPTTRRFKNVRHDDEDDLDSNHRKNRAWPKIIAGAVVALVILGVAAFFWWDGHRSGVKQGTQEAQVNQVEKQEVKNGDEAGEVTGEKPPINEAVDAANAVKEGASEQSYDEAVESIIEALDDLDKHGADDDFKWDNDKHAKNRESKRDAKVKKVLDNIDKTIGTAPAERKERLRQIRDIVEKKGKTLAAGFDSKRGQTTEEAHKTIENIKKQVSALKNK